VNPTIAIIEYAVPVARWVIAVPAGLVFALCVLGNWSLLIGGLVNLLRGRETTFSLVLPFLGPLSGVIFFLAIPVSGFMRWWWLALLIEPTWLVGVCALATSLLAKREPDPFIDAELRRKKKGR
jgi:hypothetical protein